MIYIPFLRFITWFLLMYIGPYVVLKILMRDKTLNPFEVIYTLIAATVVTFFMIVLQDATFLSFPMVIILTILLSIPFLFFYIHKKKHYSLKKTAILIFITIPIASIANLTAHPIQQLLFPRVHAWSLDSDTIIARSFALLFFFTVIIAMTILIVKFTKNLRTIINQNSTIQTYLLFLFAFLSGSLIVNLLMGFSLWLDLLDSAQGLWLLFLNLFFVVTYSVVIIISFRMFSSSQRTKYELKSQQDAQAHLQHYTGEIEQQYTAMQKFKHDSQNILSSLGLFIQEGDMEGMTQYYKTMVSHSLEMTTKSNVALGGLRHIHIREIKAILASKLMYAQSLGIDLGFEVDGDINNIYIDSVTLVRMLGIILDNAIEELETLGAGKMVVACFSVAGSVTFVVQNTCRTDMPPFLSLQQVGFSTKGEGRGFGLDNLSELASKYPNVTLCTDIANGNFIQKLIIGKGL